MRVPVALLLSAITLAGCATPGATEEPAPLAVTPASDDPAVPSRLAVAPPPAPSQSAPADAQADALVVSLRASGAGCNWFCEPSVAIDDVGRIYVLGDTLRRSDDNGSTFADVTTPPVPVPADFHGDSLIQVAPDGALFHSSLLQGCLNGCQTILLHGIQVARSTDGGESWDQQAVIRFPEPQAPGSDRQWLAFGDDGLVCLTYQRYGPALVYGVPELGRVIVGVDNNVVATCSTDGGATFPAATTVLPSGHQGLLIAGPPLIDSAGRLLVLYFLEDGAHLAASEDAGTTFASSALGWEGNFFPTIVETDAGFRAAWRSTEGAIMFAQSPDSGETWSDPVTLTAADEVSPTSPWAVPRGASTWVNWFVSTGEETNDLWLWESGNATRIATNATQSAAGRAATDYAHFVVAPDGRVLVVFGDVESDDTFLAIVRR